MTSEPHAAPPTPPTPPASYSANASSSSPAPLCVRSSDADAATDLPEAVEAALCDDLNTPKAIAEMHSLADQAMAGDRAAASSVKAVGEVLGLLQAAPEAWFQGQGGDGDLTVEAIEGLIEQRRQARQDRDFATSDRIRDELVGQGIVLEDGAGATTWRRGG